MYGFNYHRPASVAEAVKLFGASDSARYLAGGQTLVQSMKLRLAQAGDVIDLGGIGELSGIAVNGKELRIGALTRHAEVASAARVAELIPGLATLAAGIGDNQVRNMGTLGGSIANSDPAADYPAAVLGLGATIHTDRRSIAADDFFRGLYETALAEGELITAVSFPVPDKSAYAKFRSPASRFALAGVFVAKTGSAVRVAVTGVKSCAFRFTAMEEALAADFSPAAAARVTLPADDVNSDLHASAEYRAHLVTAMAKRAVEQAMG